MIENRRRMFAVTGVSLVAMAAIIAVPLTAMSADRTVLGEYFNATW